MRRVYRILITSSFLSFFIPPFACAQEVPQEAINEAKEYFARWKADCSKAPENFIRVHGLSDPEEAQSATLADPYPVYAITYEALINASSGADLLEGALFARYAFPIIIKEHSVGIVMILRNKETGEIARGGGSSGEKLVSNTVYQLFDKGLIGKGTFVAEIMVDYWDKYVLVRKDSEYYLVPAWARSKQAKTLADMYESKTSMSSFDEALPLLKDYAKDMSIQAERIKEWKKGLKEVPPPDDDN